MNLFKGDFSLIGEFSRESAKRHRVILYYVLYIIRAYKDYTKTNTVSY